MVHDEHAAVAVANFKLLYPNKILQVFLVA